MTLIITKLSINNDGTFFVQLFNTGPDTIDTTATPIKLTARDNILPSSTPDLTGLTIFAGSAVNIGHSSFSGLDLTPSDVTFSQTQMDMVILHVDGVITDHIGGSSGPDFETDTVYVGPADRPADADLFNKKLPQFIQSTEIMVNAQAEGRQKDSMLAKLADGGFVATWHDNDGGKTKIKAQVFDSEGEKKGTELLVNSTVTNEQSAPAITGLSNGGFIVSWSSSHDERVGHYSSNYAQVFDKDGRKLGGEFEINLPDLEDPEAPSVYRFNPTLAGLSNGGFAVAWTSNSDDPTDFDQVIKAQIYSSSGREVKDAVQVNSNAISSHNDVNISALETGGFVATWNTPFVKDDDDISEIKAQIFSAAGTKIGTEFLVNTQTKGAQENPTVSGLKDGNFVVTWQTQDTGKYGETSNVKAQIFNPNGTKIGTAITVNTETMHGNFHPQVAALDTGGFTISWMTNDTYSFGIKGQAFDAKGTKQGREFFANTEMIREQEEPSITALENGRFAVSWTSFEGTSTEIKAQVFDEITNATPVANNVITTTFKNKGFTGDLNNNVTDPDGDSLNFTLTSDTTHGELAFNPNGTYTYTPNTDFSGSDSFSYRVSDPFGASDTTTLNIIVTSIGDFSQRATKAIGIPPTDITDIRDFDGNDLGAGEDWKFIGQADVQFDGDAEFIYINQTIGRWATVGPDENGTIDFTTHGTGGETRVVGIYIDPEVTADPSKKFGPFDSQQRFQNDLATDNLTVIDAFDFDCDGFQEIYFKVNDGSAYLRALMHADGNIQYANYQSSAQVETYLTDLGYAQDVLDTILI